MQQRLQIPTTPRVLSDDTARVPAWRVGEHPEARRAPFAMCFTPLALEQLLTSVGKLPPESGAKGFGPKDRMGFDLIEFDEHGSARAGGAVYSPDVEWGEQRRLHHLHASELRLWSGDLHSHPGDYGCPSSESGPGLGDLGYVSEVFAQNEFMEYFLLPILTRTATGEVVIHPWLCWRGDVHRPMIADLVVCEASDFPERIFNPAWLASLETDLVEVHFQVLVPASTPEDDQVFVRGSIAELGSWEGTGIMLDKISDGRWEATVQVPRSADFEWKVTRGSWESVEALPSGADAPDRPGMGEKDRVHLARVKTWKDSSLLVVSPGSIVTDDRIGVLRRKYTERLTGLVSPSFQTRRILTVGVGAGSYAVEKLARLCPRALVNCDFDTVDLPNLGRTVYSTDDVGLPKVEALARRLQAINPTVEVVSCQRSITELSPSELDALFDGVDLVVGGTDQFEAQALVNEQAVRRAIPAVFVGIHALAAGGRIIWYVPGQTGCYRCLARERFEAVASGREDLNLDGMNGCLIDCQFLDMIATKIAVAILEAGQDTEFGRFFERMRGRNDVVVRCHPDYAWGASVWGAVLGDLPQQPKDFARELEEQAFFAMDSIWLQGHRDPDCPVCGTHGVSR